MVVSRILQAPIHFAQLATGAKSFEKNIFIGSRRLNRAGLHVGRVGLAERMAGFRRRSLGARVDQAHREAFLRNGYVSIPDYLPEDVLGAVLQETSQQHFQRYDMRQGSAVTRRGMIDAEDVVDRPGLAAVRNDRRFKDLVRYVASYDGQPLITLQVVMALPTPLPQKDTGGEVVADPQTMVHSDTFHATAKAWLFLHDVGEDDGPFCYVPGSHIVTPQRYAWERAISENPDAIENVYAARGSLRIAISELGDLGYPEPVRMTVPANTLVIADTHGFHARCASPRRTTRMEIYASLRRNPFSPVVGMHLASLPRIRDRTNRSMINGLALMEKYGLRTTPWTDAGVGPLTQWPESLN